MSEIRSQATPARNSQEMRRLALQSTAEIWRGLDVLDMELRAGQFTSARGTIRAVREIVKMTDTLVIAVTEHSSKLEQPRTVKFGDLGSLPIGVVVRNNEGGTVAVRESEKDWLIPGLDYEIELWELENPEGDDFTVLFTPGEAG